VSEKGAQLLRAPHKIPALEATATIDGAKLREDHAQYLMTRYAKETRFLVFGADERRLVGRQQLPFVITPRCGDRS
jgi:hypothetical protein